ncbi:hypothetical protein, partial [Pokkaliibacter plantistimulans]
MIRMGKMRGEILFLLFVFAHFSGKLFAPFSALVYIFVFIPIAFEDGKALLHLLMLPIGGLVLWVGGHVGMEYIIPWLIKHTRPQYELNRR